MYSHHCTGRARPGHSQLGRIYHGSRVRGGHGSNNLIVLIDVISASEGMTAHQATATMRLAAFAS